MILKQDWLMVCIIKPISVVPIHQACTLACWILDLAED